MEGVEPLKNDGIPEFKMTSVNGDYMDVCSKYSSEVYPIEYNENVEYVEEERGEDYPPIGELIPIGNGVVILLMCALFYLIIIKIFGK